MAGGRHSKAAEWLTEDNLLIIKGYIRDGHTEKQLATEILGVRPETLCVWKSRFPQLKQAIKEGQAPIPDRIEDALYSRCEWTQKDEVVEEITEHPDGTTTKHKKVTKRWYPPDTTLIIFALKNLKREKFTERGQQRIQLTESDPLSKAFEEFENGI